MAKHLAKFDEARNLLSPLLGIRVPLVLENQDLVEDAVTGFNIIYQDYLDRVPEEDPVLPKSSFLYYLTTEGALSPDSDSRELAGIVKKDSRRYQSRKSGR